MPPPAPKPRESKMDWATKPMTLAESGIVPAWLDRAADPCSDFFAYACGGFTKTATIPDDRAAWGAIEMVQRDVEEFLEKVLEDAAAKPSGDPGVDKLGAFYAACMDEGAVETAGTKPIQPYLDQIAAVTDAKSAAKEVIALHVAGFDPFFSVSSGQDLADATQVITNLDQSGLGLPDRKYYLETKGSIPKTRDAYREHMVRMFQLLGSKAANKQAANAFRIEAALAKLQQDEVVRRDPHAVYHRVERAGLLAVRAELPVGRPADRPRAAVGDRDQRQRSGVLPCRREDGREGVACSVARLPDVDGAAR